MRFSGTIPVVVGAPNILEFSPYPGSVLHIKELTDVESVAATMKHLASNPDAFNQTLRLSDVFYVVIYFTTITLEYLKV